MTVSKLIPPKLPKIETYKLLFQRREFSFITDNPNGKNAKQDQALKLLTDSPVTELMFGGAAGGAKSWTGCCWLLFNCLLYPETKWFIGRETLKDIRDSTLITFGKVAKRYGVSSLIDYRYNGQGSYITFANGSRIDFLELAYLPSDPMYERLGSKEYTGGFLEECGQIHFNAFDVLKTRIGRHLNDKYGIIARIFLTCNPKKNWIYDYFYRPYKEDKMPFKRAFIPSLATDNVFRESDYLERLNAITDKVQRARLLDGNFDYDDDPSILIDYEAIGNLWHNTHVEIGQPYLTCDVARFGRDKTVIGVWSGWRLVKLETYGKTDLTQVVDRINALRVQYHIPPSSCIADEDGVGGGVVDFAKIQGFVNNASPVEIFQNGVLQPENFANLKSQCYFKLADKINKGEVFLCEMSQSNKQDLIAELEQVKQKGQDTDNKRRVLSKDEVKATIGRSPDLSDTIMMRMFFDLKRKRKFQTN